MTPGLRKAALVLHITVSVGWIGAAAMYLLLASVATWSDNPALWRNTWAALELLGWYGIVPMAALALLTGLVMALGTAWGLARHYWVLVSFILTAGATAVLLRHMTDVSHLVAGLAFAPGDDARIRTAFSGEIIHSGLGIIVLIAIQALNVYKPRGLTPLGRRIALVVEQPPIAVATVGSRSGPERFWQRVVIGHAIALAAIAVIVHLARSGLRH